MGDVTVHRLDCGCEAPAFQSGKPTADGFTFGAEPGADRLHEQYVSQPIDHEPGAEPILAGVGVSRFKVGDRVVNSFFPNWFGGSFNVMPEQYMIEHDGWLTEYKVLNAEALVSLPDYLSFEAGATLPCAGVTAWSALAGVTASDTVLTQGTGGVSIFAIQLAKAKGARVIATTSSREKAERLRKLGADHIIDYKANPTWGEAARELTGGRGVDLRESWGDSIA